jgi:hypothetical protein
MKQNVTLLIAFLFSTTGPLLAQDTGGRFTGATVIAFGVGQTEHFYDCIEHVNSCENYDPEGMLELFTGDAMVWVSSRVTHRNVPLYPERYLDHLHGLRCPPGARYRKIHFAYDILYSKITWLVNGSTCTVSIPVKQRFTGLGNEHWADYQDTTIKQIDILCYYDHGVLTGLIKCILVESTNA